LYCNFDVVYVEFREKLVDVANPPFHFLQGARADGYFNVCLASVENKRIYHNFASADRSM